VLAVLIDPLFHPLDPPSIIDRLDDALMFRTVVGVAHVPKATWDPLDARAQLAMDIPDGVFSAPVLLDSGWPDD